MKITVTNQQINEMFQALKSLDNAQPRDRQMVFPGKTIYSLGRNLRRVKSAAEEIEETRIKLVEKHLEAQKKDKEFQGKDGEPLPQLVERGPYGQAFLKEFEGILEQTQEIELFPIKVSQLDLDKNSTLPFSVLTDLEPMLVDDSNGEGDEAKS